MNLSQVFAIQILLSLISGYAIGWQRIHAGKYIGPRTYAFVSIAATFLTMLALDTRFETGDRIIAAVLTGIGFIGGGAILHKSDAVEGLTSAAGIWLVTAVGIGYGLGYIVESISISIVMMMLLSWRDKPLPTTPQTDQEHG